MVIDANMLLLLLQPNVRVPNDSAGRPIQHAKERVESRIVDLEKARIKVLIPTPALAEVLVRAGEGVSEKIVEAINKHSVFRIEPFDARAAIEVAAMSRTALGGGRKRKPSAPETWAKLKYDWQIVAIAKVNQATAIYSNDDNIRKIAAAADIEVVGLADLPLPDDKHQRDLFLEPPSK